VKGSRVTHKQGRKKYSYLMKITELDEPGLFLLGVELLDAAGQTLLSTLEKQLKPLFGDDWFSLTVVKNTEDRELAPRDLSVLLVQIVIRNNSNFRLALRTEYNNGRPHEKSYFDLLTDLRIMRNEWFHRIINPITSDELKDLCSAIIGIFPTNTPITVKATTLHDLLVKENFSASDLLRTSKYIGGYVTKLEEIEEARRQEQELEEIMLEAYIENEVAMMDEIVQAEIEAELKYGSYTPVIGDPYTGSLLPQKYTLKLDGGIIDRREGLELKEKLGERAIEIGKSLLKNHPMGGRMRLSADGTVVGYADEEWIVIGSVDLGNWFET
jgi:hypothetical protein